MHKVSTSQALKLSLLISMSILTACGGGSEQEGEKPPSTQTQSILGGAIKGPLIHAAVTVYAYDSTQLNFKGAVIDKGSTNAQAEIIDLTLPLPLTPPYIMEFTSVEGTTTDITTGVFPVVPTLTTVLTQALIDTGEPVYATPLTTLAVAIAIKSSNNATTASEFLTQLPVAAKQIISTLGFGMPDSIDIFATPPLVNNFTTTTAELSEALAYRTAIEALVTVASKMSEATGSTGDIAAMIQELAHDLADGTIDAQVDGALSSVYDIATLTQLTQAPDTLTIPNTTMTVAQVATILAQETSITGSTSDTTDLSNGSITTDIIPAQTSAARIALYGDIKWNDGSVWQ